MVVLWSLFMSMCCPARAMYNASLTSKVVLFWARCKVSQKYKAKLKCTVAFTFNLVMQSHTLTITNVLKTKDSQVLQAFCFVPNTYTFQNSTVSKCTLAGYLRYRSRNCWFRRQKKKRLEVKTRKNTFKHFHSNKRTGCFLHVNRKSSQIFLFKTRFWEIDFLTTIIENRFR